MTRGRYKPYPAYRDSGVEWLGAIPEHWDAVRMWQISNAVSGATPAKEERGYWDGEIPWVSPKDMKRRCIDSAEDRITERALEETGIKLIPPPAVLIVVRGMILAHSFPVAVTTVPVTINQDMKALRLGEDVEPEFMAWVLEGVGRGLLSAVVDAAAHGTKAIRMDRWRTVTVALPAGYEQAQITAFLDRETAKIDALVAEKERLVELLREKRTALITHAVTKGLDPDVPMKDSGVEWLGEIPEPWERRRLKFLARRIEQGWSPLCENRPAELEEWGVLKVGCVNGESFDAGQNKALPVDLLPVAEYEVRRGDLLMSRANTRELLGSAALVPTVRPRLILCDKLYRIRVPRSLIEPRFLVRLLGSRGCRFQLEREATGASGSMQNIAQSTIRDLLMAVPPISEQQAIADHLDRETARIDALIDKVQQAITLLKERRTALISAAVTGKFDVRDEVAAA